MLRTRVIGDKRIPVLVSCMIAAVLTLSAGDGFAQTSLMEMNATMNGMNTLNAGGTGGYGYAPSAYMRTPAATPGGARMIPGGRGRMPYGRYGGAPYGTPPYGGGPPMPGYPGAASMAGYPGPAVGMPAAPAPVATEPPEKKILVLTGTRVTCAVMKTLLEDIHFELVSEEEKGEYNDEGRDGDLQAGDNIYTKIDENDEVLSPEADRLKKTYLRLLEICEETNPLEFFRIPVATEEPMSPLPRLSDEERDRDETFLRQWHTQFLKLYRKEPQDDPMSDFYPIFVPSAPIPPSTPPPPEEDFHRYAFVLDQYIQAQVDQAVAPALQPTTGVGGYYGGEYYGDEYASYTNAERYSGAFSPQGRARAVRRAAAARVGYSTAASSSYFRR